MKRILLISLAVMLIGTTAYAVENVSFRVKGMHEDLATLIQDEFTDMMFLSYNILDIEGYRLYTNLSNLSSGDEELFDNDGVDQYLIGGVAPIMEIGKLGLIYGADSALTVETIVMDITGATTLRTIGASRDGEYETIFDDKTNDYYRKEYGKADKETGETDIKVLFAKELIENLKLGLLVNYTASKNEPSNDYSFKEDFDVSDKDEFGIITYEKSGIDMQQKEPLIKESQIIIGPAGEYKVNDELSIGGGIGLVMANAELSYSETQTENCKDAYLDNFGAEVAIFDPIGNPVGLNAGGAAASSDWDATYSTEQSGKPKGTGFSGKLLVKYSLSEKSTLRGIFDLMSTPVSGNITSTMSVDVKDDGYSGDGYIQKITMSDDADITTTDMIFGAGLESKLSENLLLGIGVKYARQKQDMEMTLEGDVEVDGTKVAYTPKEEMTMEDKTTGIILPIGLEYKPYDWLSLRIGGASHTIETEEGESKRIVTTYAAVYPTKTVDTVTTVTDPKTKTTTRTTDFSFGAGFKVTENLQVDIMKFNGLTWMDDWQISATLKF